MDPTIHIDLKRSSIIEFNKKMQDLFYLTRPDYSECLLRCKILDIVNKIWQEYLIENEKDAIFDKLNKKYCDIITATTYIRVVSSDQDNNNNNNNNGDGVDDDDELKPYKKYPEDEISPLASASFNCNSPEIPDEEDKEEGTDSGSGSVSGNNSGSGSGSGNEHKSNSVSGGGSGNGNNSGSGSGSGREQKSKFNHWLSPIEGKSKKIIIYKYKDGPIIREIEVPSVMIFGSIAFGLDGYGSDIDLALPASISNPAINAHKDSNYQSKLLKIFLTHFNMNKNRKLLLDLGFEFKVEPILHARVPIIKLTEINKTYGKLQCDIGIRSTQMPITKLIRFYNNYDDRVCILYMFIKEWSKSRQIAEAMFGFPNSFGFVMLVTKFLQILNEPIIPIMDYDRKKKKIICIHNIYKFKFNTLTLYELALLFFDYYLNFDFETYQLDITLCGLQWKHSQDYNLNHSDQETMLIVDPSSKSENVTRCLKPYNLKIMKQEFFRAYKCTLNCNWKLLFKKFNQNISEQSIFNIYPPTNQYEKDLRYELEDYQGDDDDMYYDDDGDHQQQQHQHEHIHTLYSNDDDDHIIHETGNIGYRRYNYDNPHHNNINNNNNHHNYKHNKTKHGKAARITNQKKYQRKRQNK